MSIYKKLKNYANAELNVMLIGQHGVGKSYMVKQLAEEFEFKFKYYSASTLDPWVDILGIPHVDEENENLKFIKLKELEEAEFILFDELNRAHPKVLNAVLEIIQFKSVNGSKLKNLKMIWAAINPSGGEYNVEDIDPALMDRFHVYVNVKPVFSMKYMKTKMKDVTAKALKSWWEQDLEPSQRNVISPRRLEYVGTLIDSGIDWADAMPMSSKVVLPLEDLRRRLKDTATDASGESRLEVTKENLLKKPEAFIKLLETNKSYAIKLKDVIKKLSPRDLFTVRDVLEALPKDIVYGLGTIKYDSLQKQFYDFFVEQKVDVKKYPKIAEGYKFTKHSK